MFVPAYHRDPQLDHLVTRCLEVGVDDDGPWALLDDTILYPEGGGQPHDRGTIDGIDVRAIVRHEKGFLHRLGAPLEPAEAVDVVLDTLRRRDHMQQHTGQHLLSAIAEDRFGLATTSFHLGTERCDVELNDADIPATTLREIEDAVAREIEAARPIRAHWIEPGEDPGPVRSRGLPADHAGPLRVVEIEGIDRATCGGTHVASTAEIGGLALLGTEAMRGGTRLYFAAGDRWRSRLAADEALVGELRRRLGCSELEMPDLVTRRQDEIAALKRDLQREIGHVARATADTLGANAEILCEGHFEGRDAAFLQEIARHLSPGRFAFLSAESGTGGAFLIQAPDDVPNLSEIGRDVAALLGGRGGGRGTKFQGRAESFAERSRAVEILQAFAASRGSLS